MPNNLAIFLSAVVIFTLVLIVGRKLRMSSRYERSPQVLNSWSALDNGIDPSDETSQ